MDLQKVNLRKMYGAYSIEIEGLGTLTNEAGNLLSAIAEVYTILAGRTVNSNADFEKRITIIELDEDKKSIKVLIAA